MVLKGKSGNMSKKQSVESRKYQSLLFKRLRLYYSLFFRLGRGKYYTLVDSRNMEIMTTPDWNKSSSRLYIPPVPFQKKSLCVLSIISNIKNSKYLKYLRTNNWKHSGHCKTNFEPTSDGKSNLTQGFSQKSY